MTETVMLWQWVDALPLLLLYFTPAFISCLFLLGFFKNSKVLNAVIWQESLWTQIKVILPALILIPLFLSLSFIRDDLFKQDGFSGIEFNDKERSIYLLEPSGRKRRLADYKDVISFSVLRGPSFTGMRLLLTTKSFYRPVSYSALIRNSAFIRMVEPTKKRGFIYIN